MQPNDSLRQIPGQHPAEPAATERVTGAKIVVGIDSGNGYLPAVDLIARLQLDRPQLTLLHAVDTTCPLGNADAHTEAEYSKVVQNLGLRALDESKTEACTRDLKAKTKMIFCRAADGLMKEGEAIGAELLAICALKHGAWSTGYLGSATCALALNATQSLLIAKRPISHHKPLRAVLALDHTLNSKALVDHFLRLGPNGIQDVLVVSAYEVDDETAKAANRNLPMLGGDVDRWLSESFEEKNKEVVARLSTAGYQVKEKVVCASPNDAIREAMQDYRGDLLVIGATGASSGYSAKIGSVALHQISSEPYPVLMLRG